MNRFILGLVLSLTIIGIQCQTPSPGAGSTTPEVDLCLNVQCKDGEYCVAGKCKCQEQCPDEWNNYPRNLCVDEKTYRHECDLWRNRCYCRSNDAKCGGTEFNGHKSSNNDVVQYFDACRDLTSMCDWKSEEATFHTRLAMWFRDLYSQKWSVASGASTDDSLLRPLGAKTRTAAMKLFNAPTKSTYGVNSGYLSFWFCEMDRDNNGNLNRAELSKLSQLLNPSTPCLNTFLSKCGSGSISFDAWHTCFQAVKEEQMQCSTFMM